MWSIWTVARSAVFHYEADKKSRAGSVPPVLGIATQSTLAEITGKWKIGGGSRRVVSHGTVSIDRDVDEGRPRGSSPSAPLFALGFIRALDRATTTMITYSTVQ